MDTNQENPVVFISYSWDDEAHKEWVLNLANRLIANGVDVILDRYLLYSGTKFTSIIEEGLAKADKIIIVATPNYKRKAEGKEGGVGHEYSIIHTQLYNQKDSTSRFIPILRKGSFTESMPTYLGQILYVEFTDDALYEVKYKELFHGILDLPHIVKPPKGRMPDDFAQRIKLQKEPEQVITNTPEPKVEIQKPTLGKLPESYAKKAEQKQNEEKSQKETVNRDTKLPPTPNSLEVPAKLEELKPMGGKRGIDLVLSGVPTGKRNTLSAGIVISVLVIVISIFSYRYFSQSNSATFVVPLETVDSSIAKQPDFIQAAIRNPAKVDNSEIRKHADDEYDNENYDSAAVKYLKYKSFLSLDELCRLGCSYDSGYGVRQDYVEAMKLFRTAATAGNGLALFKIGRLFHLGQGVRQDYVEAMKWYLKAADKGNATAMGNIGYLYQQGQGVQQNYAEAMKWYQKAADKGEARAMTNIGCLYDQGQGVQQNYAEAMKWYQKAADKGSVDAMYNIGFLYENGRGLTQDYAEAMKWYQKAADKGDTDAMTNIGTLHFNGLGVRQDYAEATNWYEKAAAKGESNAMYNIGLCYEYGKGVTIDLPKAKEWYQKAADKGQKNAIKALERLK